MTREKKQYNKLVRRYKKRLKKLSKEVIPWDYGNLLDYILEYLHFMLDFFTEGNWVAVCNEEREEIIKSITQALEEYNAYDNTSDKYFSLKDAKGEGSIPGANWTIEVKDGEYIDAVKACREEEEEHWNNFCNIVRDNMRSWWD